MKLTGNTILITGGGAGIGRAFSERFIKTENKVIIVGRRKDKLLEVKESHDNVHIKACDVSDEKERLALAEWVVENHPELNVLVNNAGIQQRVNLKNANEVWSHYKNEINLNIDGPIHLSLLLMPHLLKKSYAAIINVTSGLSLQPGVWVPIYSATKAALHSFTVSLRHQLEDTPIEVVEVLPPAVNTDLGGAGLHTFGADLNEFADAVFKGFENGDEEIGFGGSAKRLRASRDELDQGTKLAWDNFKKNNPDF